jgi:hypothetical protein
MEENELESLMEIAIAMLAEHGLSDNFTIVNNEIIFDNDREQFLYELKGGKALYKQIYAKHSGQQWSRIFTAMTAFSKDGSAPAVFKSDAFKAMYMNEWTKDDE